LKKKICPRCGSENVKWIIPQVWSQWLCYNCDYTGPVIEADDKLQKEIQENWALNKEKILSEEKERFEETFDDESEFDKKLDDDLTDEEMEKKLDQLFEENK
jgi:ribosomal protein S27AE